MLKGMAAGNLLLASAILLSGATYTKIASLSEILNWKIFSEKTFYNIQNMYLFPVINEPLPGVLGNTGTVAFIFREQGIFSNYFQGTGELLTRLLGSREHQFTFNNGQ